MVCTSVINTWGFPGGSDSKDSACSMRDPGSIPGSGRSPGEGNGIHHERDVFHSEGLKAYTLGT